MLLLPARDIFWINLSLTRSLLAAYSRPNIEPVLKVKRKSKNYKN